MYAKQQIQFLVFQGILFNPLYSKIYRNLFEKIFQPPLYSKIHRNIFENFVASCLRGPRPLSGTCRKKMESSFVLSSQDVLNAVALENEKVGKKNQTGYNYMFFAIHTMQYTCLVISILLSHIAISHHTP